MVQVMDQVVKEGAIYGARNGLGSNRRSDGSEGAMRSRSRAMGGASDGSGSKRRSNGWCKRCIRE